MANESNIVPLERLTDKERGTSWDDVCEDITELFDLFQKIFVVDVAKLSGVSGIIISSEEPSNQDNDKIWFYNVEPYFIAFYAGGVWNKFYQFDVHFRRYALSATAPTGFRDATVDEIADFELTAPTNGLWKWMVFDPTSVAGHPS